MSSFFKADAEISEYPCFNESDPSGRIKGLEDK